MRRFAFALAIAMALGLFGSASAIAQTTTCDPTQGNYPGGCPTADVNDHVLDNLEPFLVFGDNWKPNSFVTITFESTPVSFGAAAVGPDGSFQKQVVTPADAAAGPHTVTVNGQATNGAPVAVFIPVTVTGETFGGGGGGGLAFTGTNISIGLLILAVLVVAGLGLLLVTRRRKVTAEH